MKVKSLFVDFPWFFFESYFGDNPGLLGDLGEWWGNAGFKFALKELEDDIGLVYLSKEIDVEPVSLHTGFPTWNKWKVVSGTETFQAVDLATKKMYLYRQQSFQRCELTQSILEADDPWFHREGIPRAQMVEVRHVATDAKSAAGAGSDK